MRKFLRLFKGEKSIFPNFVSNLVNGVLYEIRYLNIRLQECAENLPPPTVYPSFSPECTRLRLGLGSGVYGKIWKEKSNTNSRKPTISRSILLYIVIVYIYLEDRLKISKIWYFMRKSGGERAAERDTESKYIYIRRLKHYFLFSVNERNGREGVAAFRYTRRDSADGRTGFAASQSCCVYVFTMAYSDTKAFHSVELY